MPVEIIDMVKTAHELKKRKVLLNTSGTESVTATPTTCRKFKITYVSGYNIV